MSASELELQSLRRPGDDKKTDAGLAAAAVRALESGAFVSVDALEVTVSNGWVTMKGEVEWQYQKQDAEKS